MKKTVHIISHSHWDREWYLSFEEHRMRLVELFDDLFEIFETDPEFDSFFLDGQTILIDDYLEIKPENKDKVQKYIDEGKLKIGPFYILQDGYLISGEANTRNTLIGLRESKKWGEPTKLGYFPDTFGNIGQAPQIMKQAGIDILAFGRGVKTTGFNNLVVDEVYATEFSEMFWQGSDGTKALSILFANWYSNGNEIPTEEKDAIEFWNQKLADAEKFASTNHLLMMNGVDHQPVQKDVTKAIKLANELFPEYQFVHSNFDIYMEALINDIDEDMIGQVKGELTSQETDGWYTLTNTASSRIYLKQANTKTQNQLELISEPLALMASEITNNYPHETITYAWKTLLQNHPHDSICGCSVDPVHREMETRFEKAYDVAKYVQDEALRHLGDNIDISAFPKESKVFSVFNTLSFNREDVCEVEIELERLVLGTDEPQNLYRKLVEKPESTFKLIDELGNTVPYEVVKTEVRFDYDLPKDGFRVPYMGRFIKIRFMSDVQGFGWRTYALVEGDPDFVSDCKEDLVLENEFIKVEFKENGIVDVLNKENNKLLENFFYYENTGDIGNEYIYRQSADNSVIKSTDFEAEYEVIEATDLRKRVKMTQTWMIPKAADEKLQYEQVSVTEMRIRTAHRSKELIPYRVETIFTLNKNDRMIQIETTLNNKAKDHRIRAVFDSGLDVENHYAESVFEVIKRPNNVSPRWENPENPQRQQAFMSIHDKNYGLTIMNYGLHEYEVLKNRFVAVTILRAVGEMGDWGYFPTPEAQCQGKHSFKLGFMFTTDGNRNDSYRRAYAYQVPLIGSQIRGLFPKLDPRGQYLNFEGNGVMVTSLKASDDGKAGILRFYNLSDKEQSTYQVDYPNVYNSNLVEEKLGRVTELEIAPNEIKTIRLERKLDE